MPKSSITARQAEEYVAEQSDPELVMQPQLASVLFRYRPANEVQGGIALLNQRIGDELLTSVQQTGNRLSA